MRISQRQQIESAVRYLHQNQSAMEELRSQLGAQRRILKPDDDPQGAQQAIRARGALSAVQNSLRNLDQSQGWMEATASGLGELTRILSSARLEALRGASETLSDDIRQTIADEIHEYFQQAVNTANTQHLGYHVFAGYRIDAQPFVADLMNHTVAYQGDAGEIRHELEPGTQTVVNVAGSDPLFNAAFIALKDLYDGLMAGDAAAVRASVDALDAGVDLCLRQQAAIGARLRVLDETRSRLQDFEVDLKGLLSGIEDLDMPEAILNLTSYEGSYQAMLHTAARIMPLSLFDYLL